MFSNSKDSVQSKCYVFNGYKQGNKVCLEYLKFKLKQDSCFWCIFILKWQKVLLGRTYLEIRKQQTRYRWCCYMLQYLPRGSNCLFVYVKKQAKYSVCI